MSHAERLYVYRRRFTGSSCNPDQEGPVSDKVIEGFQGALLRGSLNQASAYLSQSKSLLVTPLRDASGAKHSAWHLACGALGQPSPALLQFLYDRFTALRLVTPLEDVLNQTNKRGRTCLGVACAAGSQECVRWLILHGSNAFHADKSGKGALHEVRENSTPRKHAVVSGPSSLLSHTRQQGIAPDHGWQSFQFTRGLSCAARYWAHHPLK